MGATRRKWRCTIESKPFDKSHARRHVADVVTSLVLSLFPGADLLGRGFEQAGYCVVRGPDTLLGQDIRSFHLVEHAFEGIIGGPPCQDFSRARRRPPSGYG